MKKKDDKIILELPFDTDERDRIQNHLINDHAGDYNYKIIDEKTICFAPSNGESYDLHLLFANEQDEACFRFLTQFKDLQRLQPEFKLTKDKLRITFFITRLSEEELDKDLFAEGMHLSDIDSNALIGLFLDNRYHG